MPVSALGPAGPFPQAPLVHELDRRWLHYAFLAPERGLALVANLSVLGPAQDASPAPLHEMAIVLLHEAGRGWRASQFTAEQPDVPWSSFRLPHGDGGGRFAVRAAGGTPGVDLTLRRTSRPCTSQCAPFADDQHLRWQSEPGVRALGSWWLDDAVHRDVAALGYHERVRGRWGWPELGGWVFGFANDPGGDGSGAPPFAVVFTLVQPEHPADSPTGSVMVWREGRLVRHFARRNLDVAVRGQLDRDAVTQVPQLANTTGVGPMEPVPRLLTITAARGDDWLVLDFRSDTAARIVIPSETSLRPFSVHEVVGPCLIEGRVGGWPISFGTTGIVEFAGGADGD